MIQFIGDIHAETGMGDDLSVGSLCDHSRFVLQNGNEIVHTGDTLALESPLQDIIATNWAWFRRLYDDRDHLLFIPGNHDAGISALSAFHINCYTRKPFHVIEHNGQRVLVSHGDAGDPMNRGDNTVGKTVTQIVGWLDKGTNIHITGQLGKLWSWAYQICERVDEWCAEQAKNENCDWWLHGHTHNARTISASKYGVPGIDVGAWFMETRGGRPYGLLDTTGLHLKRFL